MSERPKAAVPQVLSSWSSSRQLRLWLSWLLSTPSLVGAPLLLLGTWDPLRRPRLLCSTVRKSSVAPQRGIIFSQICRNTLQAVAWGFSGGPGHKFTAKTIVLEKLKELWMQVCESKICACLSFPVPLILGAVESVCLLVIPASFRARGLAFLRPSQCAELLAGVKLCNGEGV